MSNKITAYKGFNKDMTCRGFQYASGKEYSTEDDIKACSSGFHSCERPVDVFQYYPPGTSLYFAVVQSGTIDKETSDSKVASSVIEVSTKELSISEMVALSIAYNNSRCSDIDPRSPASATGRAGAASATGRAGAASATGIAGAASATGYAGKVMGIKGCALFLCERNGDYDIINVWAGLVGKDGIKANTWYTLKDGKPTEV